MHREATLGVVEQTEVLVGGGDGDHIYVVDEVSMRESRPVSKLQRRQATVQLSFMYAREREREREESKRRAIHTHEASGEVGVSADLAVDQDLALDDDQASLTTGQRVVETVAQQDDQGQALTRLVRASRRLGRLW